MRIARTVRFEKGWKQLNKEEKALARKAINNLAIDIRHPALRINKMKGTEYIWEARVSRSLRLTFQIEGDTIVLRNIGRHDETLERPQGVKKMPAYSKVTRHGQITLPASVRKELGVEEGDLVEIEVIDDRAVLVPKRLVDKSQAYFWTRKWQEGEREADEDIEAGRVRTFDSVGELIEDLEQ